MADDSDKQGDNDKTGLLKTRLFILFFFGLAILLSITTILGTWDEQNNGVIDPATANNPLTAPATAPAPAPAAK
jgi:hypothetical protein